MKVYVGNSYYKNGINMRFCNCLQISCVYDVGLIKLKIDIEYKTKGNRHVINRVCLPKKGKLIIIQKQQHFFIGVTLQTLLNKVIIYKKQILLLDHSILNSAILLHITALQPHVEYYISCIKHL